MACNYLAPYFYFWNPFCWKIYIAKKRCTHQKVTVCRGEAEQKPLGDLSEEKYFWVKIWTQIKCGNLDLEGLMEILILKNCIILVVEK